MNFLQKLRWWLSQRTGPDAEPTPRSQWRHVPKTTTETKENR